MNVHTNEALLIPLLFAEIPQDFKAKKNFKKKADKLCRRYAKQFERRLEVPVRWYYTPHNNVEFRLVGCDEVCSDHEYYMEEIIKYCLVHRYIFSYIGICNAQGKIITMINDEQSIELPIRKAPH